MSEEQVRKALSKSRYQLMVHKDSASGLLSSILLSTKAVFTEEIPRIGTNGVEIIINPKVFLEWPAEERLGALAHELWHVVLKHPKKMKDLPSDFHREQYNIAADLWINPTIKANGLVVPEPHLDEPQFHGWSIDAIYEHLLQNPMTLPEELKDIESEQYSDEVEQQLTPPENREAKSGELIRQAATISKMNGTYSGLPDAVKMAIDRLIKPKIDIYHLLNMHMDGFAKDDYSWSRRNMWYSDFYAPSLYSEKLTRLTYAVDASCSVTDHEFANYIAHIKNAMETLEPESVQIIVFDDDIVDNFVVETTQQLDAYEFGGRRGTDLRPLFNLLDEQPIKPTVLCVLSDLCCAPIEKSTEYPVIWVAINNPHAHVNFGTLIHFEV